MIIRIEFCRQPQESRIVSFRAQQKSNLQAPAEGSEFEIQLKNKLTQRAILKECAARQPVAPIAAKRLCSIRLC
jgi:hypothetical protein